MCKFLTWRQVDRVANNGQCYLTVIKAVFNINNQSTLSVISLWLSEALLPLEPPFSFHGMFCELCRRAPRSCDCMGVVRCSLEFPLHAHELSLALTVLAHQPNFRGEMGMFQSSEITYNPLGLKSLAIVTVGVAR